MFRTSAVRPALPGAVSALLLLATSIGVGGTPAQGAQPCDPAVTFDPGSFSDPTTIDNPYLPMVPGTRLVLKGQADRGGGLTAHRVVSTVTDLTKVINGVTSRVVMDRDISESVLAELELSFYAQDDAGNVWNLGEYPEEYQDGVRIGAPSTWFAGLQDAQAGIHMLANPRKDRPRYLQGSVPRIEFLDCAKVFETGLRTCTGAGCFDDVLVTDETSPLDSGNAHQRKFHAPGVGIVKVSAINDPERETLVLTEIIHLSAKQLKDVRTTARQMDERGCSVKPLYCKTPPVRRSP
ncbi:MAG: hypothetical protein M3P32_03810 [Chloroflexota bacterium]|nr:hypothetical protein [Chloroflexota bacterium]